ncbi:hypothetical protein EDD37DRAFT_610830 [Exophiala viscosa]|uniref:uncharacterized protein n=1 Tax=Exophiala viscosa TaxID=2486360 RepID=UPI002193EA56|nr:hypothetical protein EDD37DRAFT_610830 [Exophiala viscosa]
MCGRCTASCMVCYDERYPHLTALLKQEARSRWSKPIFKVLKATGKAIMDDLPTAWRPAFGVVQRSTNGGSRSSPVRHGVCAANIATLGNAERYWRIRPEYRNLGSESCESKTSSQAKAHVPPLLAYHSFLTYVGREFSAGARSDGPISGSLRYQEWKIEGSRNATKEGVDKGKDRECTERCRKTQQWSGIRPRNRKSSGQSWEAPEAPGALPTLSVLLTTQMDCSVDFCLISQ